MEIHGDLGGSDALWADPQPGLQKRGVTPIRVSAGDRFAALQPDHYQVLLASDQPFQSLLEALKPQAITTLLVLAPVGSEAI
jgi:hypothetical protein